MTRTMPTRDLTPPAIRHAARLSVAPMMDWTDRHCRWFHRLMSREALLYTEMVTSAALVRGGALHLLEFSQEEQPVALQLGGSDPAELAEAARLGEEAGYVEINLNCGCPSDRVQSGTFGAILMQDAPRVAECVAAMRAAVSVEVTVKCRIGVDDQGPETVLPDFLVRVSDAGCERFTVHARKAWLKGLSPKENREIPPLDYALVGRMRERFPGLHLSVNGGIASIDAAEEFLAQGLDGVMIGRAAYHQPYDILGRADAQLFGGAEAPDRETIMRQMFPYISEHCEEGGRVHQVTRHMLGLFHGQPGARMWKRMLSDGVAKPGADVSVLEAALDAVLEEKAKSERAA